MSTRCNIFIKLKKEEQDYSEEYPYLCIYCHHDGYVSHMGRELTTNFNSYDTALEMMRGGDTSSIDEGVSDAYNKDDDLEYVSDPETYPWYDREYKYIYENDQWYVIDCYGENKKRLVTELLNNN
jgi:hypothetical protein